MLQPNKGTTILYWFRTPKTLLIPPVNGKIQELSKAFECFSSTFPGKFNFQGLFKTVLYIEVLFKPVRTLCNSKKVLQCFLSKQDSVCHVTMSVISHNSYDNYNYYMDWSIWAYNNGSLDKSVL